MPANPQEGLAPEEAEGADADFWTAIEESDVDSLGELLETDQRDALSAVVPMLAEWRGKRRQRSAAEKLRYHVTWQPLEREATGIPSGRWLVVVPPGTETDALLTGLDMVRLEIGEADRTRERLGERLTGVLAENDLKRRQTRPRSRRRRSRWSRPWVTRTRPSRCGA